MDNKQITKERIEVMQAYVDGAELQVYSDLLYEWVKCPVPIWAWDDNEYRIKAPANWEVVKHFEEGGRVDAYENKVFVHMKVNSSYWYFDGWDYKIVNERRESNND